MFKEPLQQTEQILDCPHCKHPSDRYFKLRSYEQEIKTGQPDFGYEGGKCPGPNCEHNFAVKNYIDTKLTFRYAKKHWPFEEIAKPSQPKLSLQNRPSQYDSLNHTLPYCWE